MAKGGWATCYPALLTRLHKLQYVVLAHGWQAKEQVLVLWRERGNNCCKLPVPVRGSRGMGLQQVHGHLMQGTSDASLDALEECLNSVHAF